MKTLIITIISLIFWIGVAVYLNKAQAFDAYVISDGYIGNLEYAPSGALINNYKQSDTYKGYPSPIYSDYYYKHEYYRPYRPYRPAYQIRYPCDGYKARY
jgi:hypothetical protein